MLAMIFVRSKSNVFAAREVAPSGDEWTVTIRRLFGAWRIVLAYAGGLGTAKLRHPTEFEDPDHAKAYAADLVAILSEAVDFALSYQAGEGVEPPEREVS